MVARVPALFDPLVSDWRSRLAALRRTRATEDPARLYMKTRVLRFMLAQYSNPLLRYARPLDLVSSIPTLVNLHPSIEQRVLQIKEPARPPIAPPIVSFPPPAPALPPIAPPLPPEPAMFIPELTAPPSPDPIAADNAHQSPTITTPPPAPPARPPQSGLIIYGPIPRGVRQDFITLLAFNLGWSTTRATAITYLINKKSASFIETSPLIADRLRHHLLPYQIKADLYPSRNAVVPPVT